MTSEGLVSVTRQQIVTMLANDDAVYANGVLDFFDELTELGFVVLDRKVLLENAKTHEEISQAIAIVNPNFAPNGKTMLVWRKEFDRLQAERWVRVPDDLLEAKP